MSVYGPVQDPQMPQLEIVIDITRDGNISALGEVFFVILSGTVDVELDLTIAGENNPVIIMVKYLTH